MLPRWADQITPLLKLPTPLTVGVNWHWVPVVNVQFVGETDTDRILLLTFTLVPEVTVVSDVLVAARR